MILASEKAIKEWTDKGVWGQKTLIDFFKEHVRANPEKVCLADPLNKEALVGLEPERLTYRELDRAVDAAAEGLILKGIQKDDIVIVQLPNCWELAMLCLAITRAGGLISPVPMQWRASELKHILDKTDARAFITVKEFGGFGHEAMGIDLMSMHSFLKFIITLDEIREMSRGDITGKLENIHVDANDIFTLCWSSGTEAQPKGCPLSHNNWICQATFCFEAAPIEPGDNLITAGPLVNMASVGTVYTEWLLGGGKLVLHHPFDGPTFIKQLIKEKIHYTLLVPAVVNALLKHPQVDHFDLSAIRAITIGASPPSLWSVQELQRRWGIGFANIWGMNEGPADIAAYFDIPDVEMRVDHFPQWGKPGVKWHSAMAGNFHAKVVDPATGQEMTEIGQVGELHYKGPNVMAGYLRDPDITEKVFDSDGYFNTGDLFQIKEGNCIGFFDRTKDIIIRGGFNISAQEVENMLLGHVGVADIAAVAMPDTAMGEKVCVYVVPTEGEGKITLDDITSFMKEKGIAVYKLPERVEIIDAIPRNPVGKILKKELRRDIREKLGIQE